MISYIMPFAVKDQLQVDSDAISEAKALLWRWHIRSLVHGLAGLKVGWEVTHLMSPLEAS